MERGDHVINRGHARETVFHDDDDGHRFLQLLAQYRDRFELRIYHYCLMGNHFHILLQLSDAKGLSRMMAGLLVAYWHHYRGHMPWERPTRCWRRTRGTRCSGPRPCRVRRNGVHSLWERT